MSIGYMSHVKFKKWLCRPVDFRGLGPYLAQLTEERNDYNNYKKESNYVYVLNNTHLGSRIATPRDNLVI